MDTMITLDCGHEPTPDSSLGTGKAYDAEGHTYCYACAADRDRKHLHETGQLTAYATQEGHSGGLVQITTWAGIKLGTAYRSTSRAARKAYYVGNVDGVKVYGTGPADEGAYVNLHAYKDQN